MSFSSLGTSRLYLDDLDSIYHLLESRTRQVTIHAGNAIADGVDDLKDATRRELGDIRLVTSGPGIELKLGGSSQVRAVDHSPEAYELVRDVYSLVSSRKLSPQGALVKAQVWWYLLVASIFVYLGTLVFIDILALRLVMAFLYSLIILRLLASAVVAANRKLLIIEYGSESEVIPYRRRELLGLAIQGRGGIKWNVIAGIALLVIGIPVALVTAWVTNLFGLA
jgi:hypothetical protein